MSKEHDKFNCDQDHEANYVSGLYKDKTNKTVKEFLAEKCDSNDINNSTHAEVYKLLDDNGFIKES